MLSSGTPNGDRTLGVLRVSQREEKVKLDDEIKLAGLESLVPKELEKHLILNSNRLRTFEDARLRAATFTNKFKISEVDDRFSRFF